MNKQLLLALAVITLGAGCAKPTTPSPRATPATAPPAVASPTPTAEIKVQTKTPASFNTSDGLDQAKSEVNLVE